MSAAHSSQGRCRLHAQLPGLPHDQVAYLMLLEMRPHVFNRIEFRRICRQPLHGYASVG